MSSSNPENNLTGAEIEHLKKLEAIVQHGLATDVVVGYALAEISEARLYRGTHQTFEAYLRESWTIGRSRGYQLIEAAEAAGPSATDLDVTAVDIRLTVRKRQQPTERQAPTERQPEQWQAPWSPAELQAGQLLARLRWRLTQSSGTIADVAHQLETCATDLDDNARQRLRDDVLFLDEELATLKALLVAPIDWDAEYECLLAGEIAPFEDYADEEDDE